MKTTKTTMRNAGSGSLLIGGLLCLSLLTLKVNAQSLPNGTYVIMNLNSGQVLDARGQGTTNDTPLQQFPANGLSNQLWAVTSTGSGQYTITGVQSGRVLDVKGQGLTSGTPIQLFDNNGGANQAWTITQGTGGYCTVTGVQSGLPMAVAGNATTNQAPVQIISGGVNQQWAFLPNPVISGATYVFANANSGLAMDAQGQNTTNGTAIQQFTANNGANQEWVASSSGSGHFTIMGVQSGRVLDVTGQSTNNGTPLQLWDSNGGANQQWVITPTSSGYSTVQGVQSGSLMEVRGSATTNKAPVDISGNTGGANQHWFLETLPQSIILSTNINAAAAAIVGQYQATFTSAPTQTPNNGPVDAPLLGNGDLMACMGGSPSKFQFWLNRSDTWVLNTTNAGGPRPLAVLNLVLTNFSGASYSVKQDLLHALTTGTFTSGGTTLTLQAGVSATNDLLWVELSTTGGTLTGRADINEINSGNSSQGTSGSTEWVTRSWTSGVSVHDSATAALQVVGSSTGGFSVSPGSPVLLVVGSESSFVSSSYQSDSINMVSGFTLANLSPLIFGHETWWSNYWGKSYVVVPDQTIMQRYYLSQYVMGSGSRNTNFPPGLQGWVTTDSPEFNGDYHLNYNYEAPFYGLYAANHIQQADPYNSPVVDETVFGEQAGQNLLGNPGVYLPVGIAPLTNMTSNLGSGSFMQQKSDASYACIPIVNRWAVTRETNFASYAYPYVKGCATFWQNYLQLSGGKYIDPNDAIQENSGTDTNSIVSLAFIRVILNCAIDMSTALNVDSSLHSTWQNILTNLSPFATQKISQLSSWPSQVPHTSANSNLVIFRYTSAGTAWWPNNTLGIQHIYPGNGVGLGSPANLVQIASNTVYAMYRWVDGNGMNSFYAAAARVGYDPGTILSQMDSMIGSQAWANGYFNESGGWMENESLIPNCIQEMLMQSQEGIIRFFPDWQTSQNAQFAQLRAYGAFLVSAQLQSGVVGGVTIFSEKGGPCTVQNPWPGQTVNVTTNGVSAGTASGTTFTLSAVPNETITLAASGSMAIVQGGGSGGYGSGSGQSASSVTLNASVAYGKPVFSFTGTPQQTYILEAATNLLNPVWVPVATNTLSADGQFTYPAPDTSDEQRYYRVRQ